MATRTGIVGNDTRVLVRAQPVSLREWIREHDERWLFVVVYLGLAVGLSVFVSLFWLLAVGALHFVLEIFRQAHYRDGKRNVFLHALWEVKLDIGLILLALTLVLYIEVVLGLLGLQSAARATAVTRAGARLGSRAAAWERNLRTFLLTVDEMARIVYAAVMLRSRGAAGGKEGQAESDLEDVVGAELEAVAGTEADGVELETVELEAVAGAERAGVELAGAGAERTAAERAGAGGEETEQHAATPATRARPADPDPAPGAEVADSDPAPAAESTDPEPVLAALPPIWRERWGMGDRIGLALVVVGVLLMVAAPYVTPHDWGTATQVLLAELRPFP